MNEAKKIKKEEPATYEYFRKAAAELKTFSSKQERNNLNRILDRCDSIEKAWRLVVFYYKADSARAIAAKIIEIAEKEKEISANPVASSAAKWARRATDRIQNDGSWKVSENGRESQVFDQFLEDVIKEFKV